MPVLSLPAPIMAELRAANARRGVDFDGPHGRQFQLWMAEADVRGEPDRAGRRSGKG
jgi:hypothetical protein